VPPAAVDVLVTAEPVDALSRITISVNSVRDANFITTIPTACCCFAASAPTILLCIRASADTWASILAGAVARPLSVSEMDAVVGNNVDLFITPPVILLGARMCWAPVQNL
jgi:hypothetical protein